MNRSTCCRVDEFLVAMSHATRRRLLALLRQREMSVNEMREHFEVTLPTISYHLAILRRAGVVHTRRAGQQIFYRADPACVTASCRDLQVRFGLPDAAVRRGPP